MCQTPPYGDKKPLDKFTVDEMLWLYRTGQERDHREMIYRRNGDHMYQPSFDDRDDLQMNCDEFRDTCNKTVPIYAVIQPPGRWRNLAHAVHNYLYRRWFRPYRSEIQHERFLCKMIAPGDLPGIDPGPCPSQTTLDALLSMNKALCANVDKLRTLYEEKDKTHPKQPLRPGIDKEFLDDHEWYQIQHLFRALLIVINTDSHQGEDSSDVGTMKVCLVRTGIEDNLSAPITFDSIAEKSTKLGGSADAVMTTLETAADFVMALEARETAAFGLRPDPEGQAKVAAQARAAVRPWDESYHAMDPPATPSSQWLSDEKIEEWGWCGTSRDWDQRMMVINERKSKITQEEIIEIQPGWFLRPRVGDPGPQPGYKTRDVQASRASTSKL